MKTLNLDDVVRFLQFYTDVFKKIRCYIMFLHIWDGMVHQLLNKAVTHAFDYVFI